VNARQQPLQMPRGIACSDQDYGAIAKLVLTQSGINLTAEKKNLVVARLMRRLKQCGLGSFQEYRRLVEDPKAGKAERRQMITELTTNVTRFMREAHHFRHLQSDVLDGLIARAENGQRIRFWSAGCSSGEEPYSLAMCLLDRCPDAAGMDIRILATDIDPIVLNDAKNAIYNQQTVNELPSDWQRRFLTDRVGNGFLINESVRSLVTFRELNLIAKWPLSGFLDVVFCRNVAIYFGRDTQITLWQRFYEQMHPGAHLYIGHSERISGPVSQHFTQVVTTGFRRSQHAPASQGD